MRIAIYTSEKYSVNDAYNMGELLHSRTEHDYKFIVVRKPAAGMSLLARVKQMVVELRDGRNYLRRDQELIRQHMLSQSKPIDMMAYSAVYVDQVNDEASQNVLREFDPDIILQAGAGILRAEVFSLARIATLNVHHGTAPEIRGVQSTFWCLYYGLTDMIGVTCHKIDATLDTGDVVCHYHYPYTSGDSYIKIQEVLCRKGAEVLIRAIDIFAHNQPEVKEAIEVDSYYFSKVDYRKYTVLRANNFAAVGSIATLKTKKKPKVYCFSPELRGLASN